MWFIYRLEDPRTDETRYVGKTRRLKKRLDGHVRAARHFPNSGRSIPPVAGWLTELLSIGLRPRLGKTVLVALSESEADDFEREEIARFGDTLLNLQTGGRRGAKHAESTKAKMSDARIGRVFSPDAREKIAASKRGKPRSKATRRKIAAALTGKTLSEETRRKLCLSQQARRAREKDEVQP